MPRLWKILGARRCMSDPGHGIDPRLHPESCRQKPLGCLQLGFNPGPTPLQGCVRRHRFAIMRPFLNICSSSSPSAGPLSKLPSDRMHTIDFRHRRRHGARVPSQRGSARRGGRQGHSRWCLPPRAPRAPRGGLCSDSRLASGEGGAWALATARSVLRSSGPPSPPARPTRTHHHPGVGQ